MKVYAAQPREGTETVQDLGAIKCFLSPGLCSSTPRGDGNQARVDRSRVEARQVYAAQPREGTETRQQLPDESPA